MNDEFKIGVCAVVAALAIGLGTAAATAVWPFVRADLQLGALFADMFLIGALAGGSALGTWYFLEKDSKEDSS